MANYQGLSGKTVKLVDPVTGRVREVDSSYASFLKRVRGYTDYQEPSVAEDPGETETPPSKPKSRMSGRKSSDKE